MARHLEITPVTLSPSLPLRSAQGFGSLKGKLREGSGSTDAEILRFAQNDSQDTTQDRSQEVLSPNVCKCAMYLRTRVKGRSSRQEKRRE
jgi:hypothetical protein